jgi:predicted acyltransferase
MQAGMALHLQTWYFLPFMFAVGNAMSFVMSKWGNMSSSQVLLKIFKRTLIIFLLGLSYVFGFRL